MEHTPSTRVKFAKVETVLLDPLIPLNGLGYKAISSCALLNAWRTLSKNSWAVDALPEGKFRRIWLNKVELVPRTKLASASI